MCIVFNFFKNIKLYIQLLMMCGNIIPHTNHIFQYKYRTINKPFFSKKTYTYTTTKNLIKCKYDPILPAAHNPRGVCIF